MGRLFQLVTLTTEQKNNLVDEAIEQIKSDIAEGDVTAIDELLRSCPDVDLIGFLAEGDSKKYYKEIKE
jgi:hypothetical protein